MRPHGGMRGRAVRAKGDIGRNGDEDGTERMGTMGKENEGNAGLGEGDPIGDVECT